MRPPAHCRLGLPPNALQWSRRRAPPSLPGCASTARSAWQIFSGPTTSELQCFGHPSAACACCPLLSRRPAAACFVALLMRSPLPAPAMSTSSGGGSQVFVDCGHGDTMHIDKPLVLPSGCKSWR